MAGPWEAFQTPDTTTSGPWEQYAPKTEAAQESPTDAVLRAVKSDTWRHLPDMAMGVAQAVGAVGQLSAHLGGENQLTAPLIAKLTGGLTPQQAADQANQKVMDLYNKYFPNPEGSAGPGIYRGIGQAAVTAPVMPAVGGAGLVANTAKGAAMGAGGGVLTPVYGSGSEDDFWQKKREQAQQGAGWGGVFGAAGTVAGKVLSPVVDKGVQMLQEAGVRLTPGQAGGKFTKGIEDRLQSADLLGLLTQRRFEGITDFNRAIYARAVAPFGEEGAQLAAKADVGNKGVAAIGDYLSSKYNVALDRSVPAPVDTMKAGFDSLTSIVPNAIRQDFADALQRTIYSKVTPGGTITPSVAKAADSELGRLAAAYRGSSVASERELSLAFREAQSEIREAFAAVNPETAPMIRAADQGWSTLVQMERAGSMLGAKDGIFTPAQFLNAIKRGDTSIRDRSFARGTMLNQPLAQAAERVLPSKVPDSGTATRALLGYLASEVGGSGAGFPGAATSLVTASSLPYLPGVAPALSKVITARPEALVSLGDLLKGRAPLLALPGLGGLTNSTTQ